MNAPKREMKAVVVHEWDADFEISLSDFIAGLQGILESIPAEFRGAALLRFDRRGGDYECPEGELDVYYMRSETDEEIAERHRSHEDAKESEFRRAESHYLRMKQEREQKK